jgi:hypothetical protein
MPDPSPIIRELHVNGSPESADALAGVLPVAYQAIVERQEATARPLTIPPALTFSLSDLEAAWESWECNCGPAALAAVLGITLDKAHETIPRFDERHYTNPTMMLQAVRTLKADYRAWANQGRAVDWPTYGLARIQWAGPWTNPGVPIAARYRHSHWVGVATSPTSRGIFDVNCGMWTSFDAWKSILVPRILAENEPKTSGEWWVTNAIEIGRVL